VTHRRTDREQGWSGPERHRRTDGLREEFHTDTTVYNLLSTLAQSVDRINYNSKMIQKRNAEYLEIFIYISKCEKTTKKQNKTKTKTKTKQNKRTLIANDSGYFYFVTNSKNKYLAIKKSAFGENEWLVVAQNAFHTQFLTQPKSRVSIYTKRKAFEHKGCIGFIFRMDLM
jgi:galactose-1-phosphate uridylyltransferase